MADINQNDSTGNDGRGGGNGRRPGGGFNTRIIILVISVILALIFLQRYQSFRNSGLEEVPYSEFLTMLEDEKIKDVKVYAGRILFTPEEQTDPSKEIVYYSVRMDDDSLVDRLRDAKVEFEVVDEGGSSIVRSVIAYLIVLVVFYILMLFIMRRISSSAGGIMNVGKSNAKMYVQKKTGVTFKDVAGEEEAKDSLIEMVDFLHNPERYTEVGAKLPKGALLVGPPGTGKTLLAKAVAGEADVPFFSMSGSEFVELYVGVGASRVRDLFAQANKMAPCIIFIDEIDAIGRSRDTRHAGGDSEREQTLNQLLSEMDGFDSSKGIIVLAATNRPEVLDKALLRPGRFDRRVVVEKPDLKGREDIIKVHSKDVKVDETVNFHELALATSGAVGADLANIINEAAILAVKSGRKLVSQKDLMESVEVVFAGKEKKDRLLSPEEKRIVAYHETGHALLTTLQKHTMPVQRITIIPRTNGALGYVWQVPEEEKYLETKDEMLAHIVITMGGRAAEAIKFDSVTNGASNDIEQATNEARTMVTMYGMSEKFGMVQLETIGGQYLDRSRYLNCSDETATAIDAEVRSIIGRAYRTAYLLLKKNEAVLDAIATYLIEHETISGEEFMRIFDEISKKTKIYYSLSDSEIRMTEDESSFSGLVPIETSKRAKKAEPDELKALRKLAKKEKKKRKAQLKEGIFKVFSSDSASKQSSDTGEEKKPETVGDPEGAADAVIPADNAESAVSGDKAVSADKAVSGDIADNEGQISSADEAGGAGNDQPEERSRMPWEQDPE